MPISDQPQNRDNTLDQSINKLETLIDETDEHSPVEQVPVLTAEGEDENSASTIPILDEVVTKDNELQLPGPQAREATVPEDRLLDLIDNLEHRLTGVLQSLVNDIKDEVVDTISEEVKSQLENFQQQLESREHSRRTSVNEPDYSHLDGYRPYGK